MDIRNTDQQDTDMIMNNSIGDNGLGYSNGQVRYDNKIGAYTYTMPDGQTVPISVPHDISAVTTMMLNDGVASEFDIPQVKKDVRYQYRGVGSPDTNGNRKTVPAYKSKKSRRFETIGLITRICDLAGFELAERVVLKDKETGEILR